MEDFIIKHYMQICNDSFTITFQLSHQLSNLNYPMTGPLISSQEHPPINFATGCKRCCQNNHMLSAHNREAMNYNSTAKLSALAMLLLLLVQWQRVSGSEGRCREERAALLVIKAVLLLSIESAEGKWEGSECCRWKRVTCDANSRHVTKLDLGFDDWRDHNIKASCPADDFLINATLFLPLRQLRSLSLYGYGITGCVSGAGFESWSNLTKLEMLDLSGNNLDRSVISSLAKVSSLRTLDLSSSYIGGSAQCHMVSSYLVISSVDVVGLCHLKNLEELDLSDNFFTGYISSCIGDLLSLKLSLENNQLEGTLSMRSFSNSSHLEVLSLSSSALNFRLEVTNMPVQLEVLELPYCNFDFEPTFLYSQYKLHALDLSNTGLKGPFPKWLIQNDTNLIKLDLHGNLFTGPLELPLFTQTSLSVLDLSGNHLSGNIPVDITTKLPGVWFLNLSNNCLEGSILLRSMDSIRVLDLSDNNLKDDIQNTFLGFLSYASVWDLSNNMFYGSLPQTMNFTDYSSLMLTDNNISGEIPFTICQSSFSILDIS